MKHLACLLFLSLFIPPASTRAQGTVCNNQGNIVLFSNYDGGMLNINVDVNIPNLKIGICTYEPVVVTFSGTYLSNVTEVIYAGFNSAQNNNHCGFPITTSSFSGINPAILTVNVSPPVTLISPPNPNNILNQPNGWNYGIICLADCDVNTYQGGCNTLDQVEAYFLQEFQGGAIYSHKVQYDCWTGTRSISDGGSCCSNIAPFTIQTLSSNTTCSGACDGTATATTLSGAAPYSYLWNTGSTSATINNLCSGTYTITITDATGLTANSTIIITQPAPNESYVYVDLCDGNSYTLPDNSTVNTAGDYTTTLSGSNGCDSSVITSISSIPSYTISVNDSMCKGAVYVFPDGTLGYGSMVHTSNFISALGCDSSIITNLVDIPIIAAINSSGNQLNALQDDALYQWVNCDSAYSIISGATNQSYTPVVTGNYAAIITVPGCKDTTGCAFFLVELISGIKRTMSENVTVYPNPASQFIMVDTKSTTPDYITVRDVIGQEVIMRVQSNQTYQMIDLSGLAQGIYILEISIHHRKEFIRLVKSAD